MPALLLDRVEGAAALGRLETPHGQQQFQIIPLAPHEDGTKEDQRCSQANSSLDDHWTEQGPGNLLQVHKKKTAPKVMINPSNHTVCANKQTL